MELFEYKMSIIIRKDLDMSTGKIAVQACHACLETYEKARKNRITCFAWRNEGAKKVVLKVDSLDGLLTLRDKAIKLKLPYGLIIDRGLTEIPPNTPTALGIGPSKSEIIDKITRNLPLL